MSTGPVVYDSETVRAGHNETAERHDPKLDKHGRRPRNEHMQAARMSAIGEELRKVRGDRAESQLAVARRAGVSRPYVGHIEQGNRVPTRIRLAEIIRGYACPGDVVSRIWAIYDECEARRDTTQNRRQERNEEAIRTEIESAASEFVLENWGLGRALPERSS